jgi:hypothetical protein
MIFLLVATSLGGLTICFAEFSLFCCCSIILLMVSDAFIFGYDSWLAIFCFGGGELLTLTSSFVFCGTCFGFACDSMVWLKMHFSPVLQYPFLK